MVAPTSFFSDYGCHVRILEEIWALEDAGHSVLVCTYHMGGEVPGVKVARSLDVPWRKGVQVGSSRHKLYFDLALGLKSIQTALKFKPDIIHAHLHEGALIGWITQRVLRLLGRQNIPLIFDYQGSLTSEMLDHHFLREDGPFYGPTLLLEKLINRMAGRVVTSSYNAAEILIKGFNYPPEKVTTVTDRVNTSRIQPLQTAEGIEGTQILKQELGIPEGHKVVVYLGLLAQYQGTEVLLQASKLVLQELPEVHFVIMGYPGVDSYRALANYLGLDHRVVFPGRIPYSLVSRYLSIGDVAVAPKKSLTEGAGKILNYMAMGLPVVASDTPVSREILGDFGLFVEPGNPVALAQKLIEALLNPERNANLGRQLRAKAMQELNWDEARCQLEQVYRAVLSPGRQVNLASSPAADSSVDFEEQETTSTTAEILQRIT